MSYEIDPEVYRGKAKPGTEGVWEALCEVNDPELHMNVVSLGLIYDVEIKGDTAMIKMTLTSPGCPYGPQLMYAIDHAATTAEGVEHAELEVVWDPPWGPEQMSEEARLELGFDI